MKSPTDIEKIVYKLLKELGLRFKREYRLDYYKVDFFLLDYKLSIQCDGCFHHGCRVCYKDKKLYARQRFQRQKDQACMVYHRYKNINIIRFPGCMIHNSTPKVAKTILDSIQEINKGNKVALNLNED